MNKREREARNAVQTVIRGLRLQLRAMLERSMNAHMGDFIAHAQAGRGFQLSIHITNADGSPWIPDEHLLAEQKQAVGEIERTLQLVKDDPDELCANCAHKRSEHLSMRCGVDHCRCTGFLDETQV